MKTTAYLVKLLFCVWLCIHLVDETYSQTDDPPLAAYPFGAEYIDLLYQNDSILHAKKIIQQSLEQSLQKKDTQGVVMGYNAIATLYEKLGNYEISKDFYEKALQYALSKNQLKISLLQNKLLNVYIKGAFFESFDSLYPIAQSLSQKLQTENTLTNYLLKTMKYFGQEDFSSMLHFTDSIIPVIKKTEIGDLKYSKKFTYKDFKELLLYQLRLYNGLSKIKDSSAAVREKGYRIFLTLNTDSLQKSFAITDLEIYSSNRVKSFLLNYQAKYYFQKGVMDSAALLYAWADNEKYRAIKEYEKRLAINGSLLYQAAKDEEEITHKKELLAEQAKLFLTYKIMASGALIASFILLSFLVYYTTSQKKIKLINSQLIQKNKELLNYDKERKKFFEVVSHELRTPVYGVNGLVTMIETEKDPDQKKRYFASLKNTASHISMLIDNVLKESEYNFDDRKLNIAPVNIRTQMENIYESFYVFVKEKSLHFKHALSIKSDNLILLFDRITLNQIIINLLYNAIKNSDHGKAIYFDVSELSRNNEKVTLQFDIIDEGHGLHYAEDISEFTVYEQQKNLKRAQSGSGLGLIIVQQLLKKYDAELFVKSEFNKGTHFRFTLLLSTGQTSPQAYQSPEQQQSLTQEKRILVVDDNPLNLLITRTTVEKMSPFIKVTTADSGAKAIDLFKYINFDLVLMDLNMPDKDGFETTMELKALNKNVPVIALTALSYNNLIESANQAGMEDVITKPYDVESFKKIIKSYFSNASKTRS